MLPTIQSALFVQFGNLFLETVNLAFNFSLLLLPFRSSLLQFASEDFHSEVTSHLDAKLGARKKEAGVCPLM